MDARLLVTLLLLLLGYCTKEGAAQVKCYSSGGCQSQIGQFNTPLDCCMRDDAESYESGSEPCVTCLAYGWKDMMFPFEVSKGEELSLTIGYIRGSAPGQLLLEIEFDPEDVEVNVGVNGTEFTLAAVDIMVPVKVLDDGEPVLKDKIITLTLLKKAGGESTDIFVSEATLIIRAPIVDIGFNTTAITVMESDGKAVVCVSATSINPVPITLDISKIAGNATEGVDFEPPVPLVLSANSTRCAEITLTTGDGYELTESLSLLLTTANASVDITQNMTEITILDTEKASIVLDPVREMVTEGDEEAKRLCVRVNNSNIDIPVRFPDDLREDVAPAIVNDNILLPANGSSVCIEYTVIDDAAVEDTEEISVTFKGVEPHVEPDVESAEFLLIIEDNDNFTLRLVDGVKVKATETSGLVEVWRSEWRSVCDDYWTDEDANVVCKELGFLGFGGSVIREGRFKDPKDKKYWLDDVKCKGNESSISECPHREWGKHNCGQGERAGVNCLKKSDIVMHLSNDSGIIELNVRGEWLAICASHWTNNDAGVVCRQLGYSYGTILIDDKAGEDVEYGIDFVKCKGEEENLLSCDYIERIKSSKPCKSGRAGVICV